MCASRAQQGEDAVRKASPWITLGKPKGSRPVGFPMASYIFLYFLYVAKSQSLKQVEGTRRWCLCTLSAGWFISYFREASGVYIVALKSFKSNIGPLKRLDRALQREYKGIRKKSFECL